MVNAAEDRHQTFTKNCGTNLEGILLEDLVDLTEIFHPKDDDSEGILVVIYRREIEDHTTGISGILVVIYRREGSGLNDSEEIFAQNVKKTDADHN